MLFDIVDHCDALVCRMITHMCGCRLAHEDSVLNVRAGAGRLVSKIDYIDR